MRDHFLKLKSNLELDPTFADSITTRHTAIRTYLENNLTSFKDSKLIGSLQRQTRIHPGLKNKFDIDIMVVMGDFYNWVSVGGISAQQALNELHATVIESPRYGDMNPIQDPPTVTLTYSDDIEVQLVPAYVDRIGKDHVGNELGSVGRGYWVAKNGRWEMADYDHEADYISQKNKLSDGYLIPTIKMLKAIKRIYFPELDSFPLEIIAASIIPITVVLKQTMNEPIFYHDLLLSFFTDAPAKLDGGIHIPGSKSAAIVLPATTITSLKETFGTIANYIRSTNQIPSQAGKVECWRKLCGDHFPATLETI